LLFCSCAFRLLLYNPFFYVFKFFVNLQIFFCNKRTYSIDFISALVAVSQELHMDV